MEFVVVKKSENYTLICSPIGKQIYYFICLPIGEFFYGEKSAFNRRKTECTMYMVEAVRYIWKEVEEGVATK